MKDTSFFQARGGALVRAAAAMAVCALMLAGCGGSAPLFTGDGRPTTVVECSAAGPWDNCTEHAKGLCGGDIDVIQKTEGNGKHKLLFACKAK